MSLKRPASSKKVIEADEKVERLRLQLAEVVKSRKELMKASSSPKSFVSRVKASNKSSRKSSLHRTNLDYVMAQMVNSPYMTKPADC